MKRIGKLVAPLAVLALALAGCHNNQNQNAGENPASNSGDPANANLAPSSYSTAENPPAPPLNQTAQETTAQAPAAEYPSAQGQDTGYYGETDEDVASEPPPPIPDYDQPPAPDDDSLWTPGYWAYAPTGYYWVPGAWVMAPWVGALWTPGYWGFYEGRYNWNPGYWGPHIGFYGGVNYGAGYYGRGYQGGYWRDSRFYYNRDVTHVGGNISNVYNYRVDRPNSRVSYNGGRDGLNYRPTPQESAARNERHYAPLAAQQDLVRAAGQNRAQFASQNQGRPQMAAQSKPVNSGRQAPAARAEDYHSSAAMPVNREAAARKPMPPQGPTEQARPEQARPANRPAPVAARPEQARPEQARPTSRPAPAARPEQARPEQARPEQARPTNRPAPAARPEQARPEQARPTNRPAPAARPEQARPEQARPAKRPAPAARPESKQAEPH